jgi:hypothetical protein
MSKLRGLSGIDNKSSAADPPCLRTARRPEKRQSNSRFRQLLEAYDELRKPLDLPVYIDRVDANQTVVSKVVANIPQSNVQNIGSKPVPSVPSKNRKMARCRNESSRGAVPAVSQRKKIDDTKIRDTSTTDAGIQTVAEVEPQTFRCETGPSRVSACVKATNSEPMYKVLAVSSRGQSRRDKTLPETLLLNNDSSRPALERAATTTDTENSAG